MESSKSTSRDPVLRAQSSRYSDKMEMSVQECKCRQRQRGLADGSRASVRVVAVAGSLSVVRWSVLPNIEPPECDASSSSTADSNAIPSLQRSVFWPYRACVACLLTLLPSL